MEAKIGSPDGENHAIALIRINDPDSIEKIVEATWKTIRAARYKFADLDTHLNIKENLQNKTREDAEALHEFYTGFCLQFLPAFVDKINISNMFSQDCSSTSIEDVLRENPEIAERAKNDPSAYTVTKDSSPLEIINTTTPDVEYDKDIGLLHWKLIKNTDKRKT